MNYKLEGEIIGFDLGAARTGVARLNTVARIAEPLEPIGMSRNFIKEAKSVIENYKACCAVVGIPRGMEGQDTDQTKWAQKIFNDLKSAIEVPVFCIDETLTTKHAEERALPGQSIDSVAAGIIVEDFTNEVLRGSIGHVSF